MNQEESTILHHHAVAINWLCSELATLTHKSPTELKVEAFTQALNAWRVQPPDVLEAMLDRNISALRAAIEQDNHE